MRYFIPQLKNITSWTALLHMLVLGIGRDKFRPIVAT